MAWTSFLWWLLAFAGVGPSPARAHDSASVLEHVLADQQPSGWTADSLTVDDIEVRWQGPPSANLSAAFVPDSIEWVRVDEQLVLPRARLRLSHVGCVGGVSYEGHHQELSPVGETDVQVVVLSGEQHPVLLSARCRDEDVEQRITLARRPRQGQASPVSVDVGCSVAGLSAARVGGPSDDWVYVGCKRVFEGGLFNRTQVLDVRVHWDNVGDEVWGGGRRLAAAPASVWEVRLRPGEAPTTLVAGSRRLELRHRLPAAARFGMAGVGFGPAAYAFSSPAERFATLSPFATLYLSYRVSDTSRLVSFGGLHLNEKRDTDVGVYLNSETARFFDRRASLNVLLGAQLIGFMLKDTYETRIGVPQGAEVVIRDVGFTGWNVLAGGFFYPPIGGKIYASFWLRYGSPRLFIEANGMFRQEPLDDGALSQAESIGVSVGAPLLFFL